MVLLLKDLFHSARRGVPVGRLLLFLFLCSPDCNLPPSQTPVRQEPSPSRPSGRRTVLGSDPVLLSTWWEVICRSHLLGVSDWLGGKYWNVHVGHMGKDSTHPWRNKAKTWQGNGELASVVPGSKLGCREGKKGREKPEAKLSRCDWPISHKARLRTLCLREPRQ